MDRLTNPPFGGKEGKDAQKNFAFETSSTQVLFVQDILKELSPTGTCAIVLDEGLLFRTNESAFVETKRKLTEECSLWCILSLPGGVFSTAGAGVKTNLLFFTKGKKTEKIWYYDLSYVKVGKKTPLTLAHFGFGRDGEILEEDALPATLTSEWASEEANEGKLFPSYARMLAHRGTKKGESRYSWTVDFADKRKQARADMQPLQEEAAKIRGGIVDLKVQLRELKRSSAAKSEIDAIETAIAEKQKSTRELEARAAEIDAATFDLKAVNPNAVIKRDNRTPEQIIQSIEDQGKIVSDALVRLRALLNQELPDSPSPVARSSTSEPIRTSLLEEAMSTGNNKD
jgi:type I restriction enzyme M protein